MKRVGIITINGNKNYGNRLQNYALTKYISDLDCDVKTIWKKEKITKKIKKNIKKFIILSFPFLSKSKANALKREKYFVKFTNTYINNYYIESNKVSELDTVFDYYAIGSDQVWNPDTVFNYFGMKIFNNKNTIFSYAPSLGLSQVSDEYTEQIKNNFTKEKIKYLSVREDAGKSIIENATNRDDVQVLIDPTMLIEADDWKKLSKKPKNLKNEKFILCYFLGELSSERKNEIDRIAKEKDCEIINILDKKSPYYIAGPSEFLYLEENAQLICTDSFHSSVFAILFNRPFIIFEREQKNWKDMNSRLDTLITKFNLKNRKFEGKITKENLDHDYTDAYKILEKEREKSKLFINAALEIDK